MENPGLPIETRPHTFRQAAACTRFLMFSLKIDFLGTAGLLRAAARRTLVQPSKGSLPGGGNIPDTVVSACRYRPQ
jgi:hypothetical protein